MPPPPPTTAHPLHQVLVQIGPKAPAPALPTDVVVVPPSNGSASDSGAAVGIGPPLLQALPVRDWIFMKIPGVQPDDVDRIEKAFSHAEFDPNTHVVDEVVEWQFDDKMWVRVPLAGFQTGEVSLIEPETGDIADWVQEYRGIHCTTTRGALGIMKDRKLIPGGYGNAAYARLTEASDSVDVIETIICPGATANKNQSDVMWEVKASGHSKNTIKWQKGNASRPHGTAADMELAAKGYIAHYKDNDDNRWLVPLQMLSIRAVWLTRSSFDGLDKALVAMRMRL
jgi:hypothetical protein